MRERSSSALAAATDGGTLRAVRTGPDFRETHELSDGTRVVLRHIRPDDAAGLRIAFERLSPESRYRRFFGGVAQLSDAALRYLTQVDGTHHVAIVATRDSPDLKTETGVGVARFVRLADDPSVAEAAVTVVDDQQCKGLGHLLALTLSDAARERGVRTFRAEVLASNEPMVAIMGEVGAHARDARDGVVVYDVPLDAVPAERGGVVDRLLRAAAVQMAVLLHRLAPPAPE